MQFNVIQWLCYDKTELSWLVYFSHQVFRFKVKNPTKKFIKSNKIHIIQISHNNMITTYDNKKPTDHLSIVIKSNQLLSLL